MSVSERMCIVTRAVKPPDELVRFVLSPDDCVTPDLKRKLPGRGVWVTARRALIDDAARKGLFSRGFRQKVDCDAGLSDLVRGLLRKEALNLLSLSKRAGLVVSGFEKVSAALGKGRIRALISAADAGEDGVKKLTAKARVLEINPDSISIFDCDELSLALGQTNVVHAAVRNGDLADRLVRAARRFEIFDGSSDGLRDAKAAQQTGLV